MFKFKKWFIRTFMYGRVIENNERIIDLKKQEREIKEEIEKTYKIMFKEKNPKIRNIMECYKNDQEEILANIRIDIVRLQNRYNFGE